MSNPVQLGLNVEAKLPVIPNFIRAQVGGQEQTLPVMAFTEDDLRKIGQQWTEALIANRQRQLRLKALEGGKRG